MEAAAPVMAATASPVEAAAPVMAASRQAPAQDAIGNGVYKATAGIGMDQALENNRCVCFGAATVM